jgi:hypothetical protein
MVRVIFPQDSTADGWCEALIYRTQGDNVGTEEAGGGGRNVVQARCATFHFANHWDWNLDRHRIVGLRLGLAQEAPIL